MAPPPPRPVGNLCAAAALRVARVCDTVTITTVTTVVTTTRVVCGFTGEEEENTRESTGRQEGTTTTPCRHVLRMVDADMRGVVESARAALNGDTDEAEFDGGPQVSNEIEWAAAHGGVVCLAGVLSGGVPDDLDNGRVLFCAGWSGDAHTAAMALANFPVREGASAVANGAAANGHISLLEWARKRGCTLSDETACFAAQCNQVEVLKYLHANNCPWSEEVAEAAAFCGHLDVLRWAHGVGLPLGPSLCAVAATEGHLDVVRWAREEAGCPWTTTCTRAALGGHLELLMWAHSHGAPWGPDNRACVCAAGEGHVDVLRYAVENGCPWSAEECAEAAERNGHDEVARWAREHRS